jgi:hypothetical protein
MTFRFKPLVLIAFCLLTTVSIQAYADIDKNSKFMQHSPSQRAWYYLGAFDAIGHVVTLKNKSQGDCIYAWYFSNPEARKTLIENTLLKYPDHSPTAILIALLRKDCGDF